jgi:hypothetical protein
LLLILKSLLKNRSISWAPARAASVKAGLSMGKDNKRRNPPEGKQ